MGIEPTSSAWKAEVLPLNYTRTDPPHLVEGGGFEPPKAEPPDLQSGPFDRSGTPPNKELTIIYNLVARVNRLKLLTSVSNQLVGHLLMEKIHRFLCPLL